MKLISFSNPEGDFYNMNRWLIVFFLFKCGDLERKEIHRAFFKRYKIRKGARIKEIKEDDIFQMYVPVEDPHFLFGKNKFYRLGQFINSVKSWKDRGGLII